MKLDTHINTIATVHCIGSSSSVGSSSSSDYTSSIDDSLHIPFKSSPHPPPIIHMHNKLSLYYLKQTHRKNISLKL